MIEQIYTYFSIEMIYLWLNIGVMPFWILLFFFPQTKLCKIFVTSIFPILIFAAVDLYLIFEIYKTGFNLLDGFSLYLGLDELINIFSDQNYVILFWVHFLGINLFFLFLFSTWFSFDLMISKIMSSFFTLAWNFSMRNYYVFRDPTSDNKSTSPTS